jgi:hypothetical protein
VLSVASKKKKNTCDKQACVSIYYYCFVHTAKAKGKFPSYRFEQRLHTSVATLLLQDLDNAMAKTSRVIIMTSSMDAGINTQKPKSEIPEYFSMHHYLMMRRSTARR